MSHCTPRNHPAIEIVPRDALVPNPHNARKHNTKQQAALTASLRKHGFLVPIVVDDHNLVVSGNLRWHAAADAGYDEVPVIRARFLTEHDREAFALADNRIAELGSWDDDLLAEKLTSLFDAGYDLGSTGFDLGDLDFSLGDATRPGDDDVELPAPDAVAVTRPGDTWRIGPHRLVCGNAREPASYEAALDGELARLIVSDPPYNTRIAGNVSGLGKRQHREFAEASGEMSTFEFVMFLRSVFRNCAQFAHDGSIHFHFIDWRHVGEMLDAAKGVYSDFKQLIVWKKSNGSMGTFYRNAHELICVFKAGHGRHVNNFGLGETGRYRTNVWEAAGANTFRKGRAADLDAHPTVKPVSLFADAILDCSERGDLVLDPFCGSGTLLVAAHRTGRRGAVIEIDPVYVDVALRRLKAASGLDPVHADGRSFEEVAAERRERVDG